MPGHLQRRRPSLKRPTTGPRNRFRGPKAGTVFKPAGLPVFDRGALADDRASKIKANLEGHVPAAWGTNYLPPTVMELKLCYSMAKGGTLIGVFAEEFDGDEAGTELYVFGVFLEDPTKCFLWGETNNYSDWPREHLAANPNKWFQVQALPGCVFRPTHQPNAKSFVLVPETAEPVTEPAGDHDQSHGKNKGLFWVATGMHDDQRQLLAFVNGFPNMVFAVDIGDNDDAGDDRIDGVPKVELFAANNANRWFHAKPGARDGDLLPGTIMTPTLKIALPFETIGRNCQPGAFGIVMPGFESADLPTCMGQLQRSTHHQATRVKDMPCKQQLDFVLDETTTGLFIAMTNDHCVVFDCRAADRLVYDPGNVVAGSILPAPLTRETCSAASLVTVNRLYRVTV